MSAATAIPSTAEISDDEAALFYTTSMWGSDAYPVQEFSGRWHVGPWRSWKGFPTCHKTKKAAVAQFELWREGFLRRWAEFKQADPQAILTGIGIKLGSGEYRS